MKAEALLPATAEGPTDSQRLFVRYFTAVLIDLLVLNLFVEYSSKVSVDTFTTSLLAAILLQILLKVTIAIEHRVAGLLQVEARRPDDLSAGTSSPGSSCSCSKFVILEALSFAFGDKVRFEGRFHGLLTLIVVVVVMLVAEEVIVRIYRRLGNSSA